MDDVTFTHPVYRKVVEEFKSALKDNRILDSRHFLHHPDESVRELTIDLVSRKYEVSENWEKKYHILIRQELDVLKDASFTNILRLKFRIVQKMIRDNMTEMKETDNAELQEKLMKRHHHLKKIEMGIAASLGNVTV